MQNNINMFVLHDHTDIVRALIIWNHKILTAGNDFVINIFCLTLRKLEK
jgi:hypothetical protein